MADVIEQAKARRAELMAEVGRIDELLGRHKALASEIAAALSASAPSPAARLRRTVDSSAQAVKRGPNGSSPEQIVAGAIKAVNRAGRPMTRYELVDAVEQQGLTVGGTDKGRNMGTILWRSGAFDNEGEGYKPKGWKPIDKDRGL